MERLCLPSKHVQDGVGGVADTEYCGKGMGTQIFFCELFLLINGTIKYLGKAR
jgi:hypothetical protein